MLDSFRGCLSLFLIFIILVLSGAFIWYKAGYAPTIKYKKNTKHALIIDRDDTLDSILIKIDRQNIHRNIRFLKWWMKLKKYNKPTHLGYYKLPNGMSNNELVNTLISGNQSPVKVTFNNIITLKYFCRNISQKLLLDSTELYDYVTSNSYLKRAGFDKDNILGLFIPNTYEFYYTVSVKDFCKKMNAEYHRFWNEKREEKLKKLKFTRQQVSILAAIVDGETLMNDEKPRIAGVYINRLRKGILLQADPTLKFIADDKNIKRILNKHKRIEHPYNTYKYRGLPPGLIRQPSMQGIDAVLNYEKHGYLFFCAKDDFSGYHVFAKSYKEHKKNARKFQKALNEEGIFR